jgi:predicted RNase H-like HicB family nuclease
MVININVPDLHPSNNLKVTLLVETLSSDSSEKVAASILEFPDCRVEAETREKAIDQIKIAFLERLKHIEAISWDVPVQSLEPAWMKFAGVFQDDLDFKEIMEKIRAERTSNDDSEVDPSYYL